MIHTVWNVFIRLQINLEFTVKQTVSADNQTRDDYYMTHDLGYKLRMLV